ncbi:MAG: hypothetical protein WA139_01600 [Candidatus Aenigmatarchaeota archaeon]
MTVYMKRQGYKRKLVIPVGKKVKTVLTDDFFEFYENLEKNGSFGTGMPINDAVKKMKDFKNSIPDKNVGNNIEYLLYVLHINKGKEGYISKAVKEFEKHLLEATRTKYDITLVIDGNL